MKKVSIIFLFLIAEMKYSSAQSIGIGTTTPQSSAVLDVSSNNKGFLPPLVSQSQRIAIVNPANGLLVYDTTSQRFYLFQDGAWRFIINSDYWSESTSRKFLTNLTDSVGIGTSLPQHRLDVNGDINTTESFRVGTTITASGSASSPVLSATGNINASGSANMVDYLNGGGDVIIDNPSATLQMKVSGVNKGFFQIAGNDLRLGTNSGNEAGEIILRVNGTNVASADKTSAFALLNWLEGDQVPGNTDLGRMVIGNKVMRAGNPNNLLTILYGQVFADGFSPSMWPTSGSSSKISTGVYEIDPGMADVSSKGVIVVTAVGSIPRICIGRYYSSGKFRVEIFNMAGNHVDDDFYFMINDPLN